MQIMDIIPIQAGRFRVAAPNGLTAHLAHRALDGPTVTMTVLGVPRA